MVGTFLGDTEILRMNILQRQKAADQAADQAESLIKQHKVASAGSVFQQAQPPTCESRFKTLAGQIQQADVASERLMRQGDEIVDRKPMKAMSYYTRARDVNVEVANFDQRMATAQDTKRRLGQHTTAHKVLIVVLVCALLGGLGYAASKQKKQGGY
jgi:site-specific recombinase